MSADLTNTVDLLRSDAFRDRVTAVVTEHAVAAMPEKPSTASDFLAARVIHDAPAMVAPFVRLVADDQTVSATGRDFTDEDLRRVVAEKWATVATATPNLQ